MNCYADLGMFRRNFAGSSALDSDDSGEMVLRLKAAARRVDEYCRRKFYSKIDTLYLDGHGCGQIRIPDLISATTVKVDEDGDRVYELTLASATDYFLEREFYHDVSALPATVIRLDAVNGQRSVFPCARRAVEIVGRWGYSDDTEVTGQVVPAGDMTSSATTLDLASETGFEIGQTLRIDDEDISITGKPSALTIVRGANGTTAAAHLAAAVISRVTYPPEVVDATLILAGRTWKRKDMAYANVLSNEVSGTTSIFRTMDPDVEALLAPLRRWEA